MNWKVLCVIAGLALTTTLSACSNSSTPEATTDSSPAAEVSPAGGTATEKSDTTKTDDAMKKDDTTKTGDAMKKDDTTKTGDAMKKDDTTKTGDAMKKDDATKKEDSAKP
jgi:hypothetical protein